jgi:polyphosphate kinase
VLQPDGSYLRDLKPGDGTLFDCHRFFMENPSLSGRGTAGAKDVPKLAQTAD